MVNPISASVSGLYAQTQKFANTAQNIVNADTESRVGSKSGYQPVDTVTLSTGGGVRAATQAREPAQVTTYSPSSPLANAQGEVAVPNVNVTEELLVGKQAEQAYKAAASVLRVASEMEETLLNSFDRSV